MYQGWQYFFISLLKNKKNNFKEISNIGHECSIIMNSFHCSYKKTCCFPCRRNLFLQCSEDSCPVRWSKVSGAKLVKGTFCRPSWSMVYMATTGERKSVYHSTSPIMVQKIHTVLTLLYFWECIYHKLHSVHPVASRCTEFIWENFLRWIP